MVADADYNILYLNHSLLRMFENARDALVAELGEFDAANLIGKHIDFFHRQPDMSDVPNEQRIRYE